MRSRGTAIGGTVVVLLAVIAVGVVRIVGARRYDDLGPGSFQRVRGDLLGGRGAPPPGRGWRIRFHRGEAFTIGLSLRNGGDRGVNVREVGLAGSSDLRRVGMRMATRRGGGPPRRIVPFRDFDLPAGKERYVQVTFLMGRCARAAGTSLLVDSVPVRYRVAFYDRETDVRLESPVKLVDAGGPRCRRR